MSYQLKVINIFAFWSTLFIQNNYTENTNKQVSITQNQIQFLKGLHPDHKSVTKNSSIMQIYDLFLM